MSTPPPAGVVRMADVDPVEVEWVWHPYIPRGKLTLLEGDPGQGKSWIALAIAAALSVGRGLPGEDKTTLPSRVLVMTAEDGLDDTIRPRLDSMDADVTRIYACESVDPLFLTCAALTGAYLKEARGVGIFHLGKTNLAAWPTPIPPIAEQARIVEILEGHLSRPGNHG